MMEGHPPKISVVMPVYKGDEYLSEAVDSILNQTFSDIDLIVICDDPTDITRNILDKYKQSDSRIKIHYQKREGLVNSLNRGFSLAQGEYIARMDADDVSLPERFEKQIAFMENHPEVGVCGTWIKTIGLSTDNIWIYPLDHESIKCLLLFNSSLAHPSVIIRRSLEDSLDFLYNSGYIHAEDYELWVRSSEHTHLANIAEVLLLHRIHPGAIGQHYSSDQKNCADQIRYRQLREFLGLTPTKEEMRLHSSISIGEFETRNDYLSDVNQWLLKIWTANQEREYFDESILSADLAKRWYAACNKAAFHGLETWKQFRASPLYDINKFTKKEKYSIFVKCLLKLE